MESSKPCCYIYIIVSVNDDAGPTVSRTTIKVKNGKVISRSYKQTGLFHDPDLVLDSWEENTPRDIESHDGQYGTDISPAVNLDKIYAYCKNNILNQEQDLASGEDSNSTAFETFENGVITCCAFYVGPCARFCGDIINIGSFKTC